MAKLHKKNRADHRSARFLFDNTKCNLLHLLEVGVLDVGTGLLTALRTCLLTALETGTGILIIKGLCLYGTNMGVLSCCFTSRKSAYDNSVRY